MGALLLLGLLLPASATRRHPRPHPNHPPKKASYPSREALNNLHITTTEDTTTTGSPRIIGGSFPSPEEYLTTASFVVALLSEYKPGYYAQFCGGTLVEDRFILTAAHCIAANAPTVPLYAVIGRRVLTDTSQGEIIPIEASFVHPSYEPDSVLSTGDIAVSRLAWPTTLSPTVLKPVRLITPLLALEVMGADNMATIFGYGRQEGRMGGWLGELFVYSFQVGG